MANDTSQSCLARDYSLSSTSNEPPVALLEFVDTRIGNNPEARIPIWEHEIFKIGRHTGSNQFVIDADSDNLVSRNHCEVYTIIYEPGVHHIYVRDRKSINGTYVNNVFVGSGPQLSPGYLLQDGDIIEIRPYWKFTFTQLNKPSLQELTNTQIEESQLFAHKYELTRRCLGKGAEAAVYLTVEPATRRQLVCKVFNIGRHQNQGERGRELLRRNLQETDILRQLQHPNILPYIDAIRSPNTLYTFTDLASGGDLMSFLSRHGRVPEFDTRILIRQIVRGLGYLHRKGIVHRDLKPENVLLAYSPKIAYHRVMLSDFGACAVPKRSRMMTMIGTYDYLAPERFTKSAPQTEAVDVWALGVITLLLTGGPHTELNRLDQGSVEERLWDHFENYEPKMSSHGEHFIRKCLCVSPPLRMSIAEAGSHDWLCTPEKHLEFFQRFDERMMADWHLERQVKPIPWELQSFGNVEPQDRSESEIDMLSQKSAAQESNVGIHRFSDTSKYFSQDEQKDEMDESCKTSPEEHEESVIEPSQQNEAPDSAITPPDGLSESEPQMRKVSQSKTQRNHPGSKRKRKLSKIPDFVFLPLTGLDRHLPRPQTGLKREVVLEALTRNSSMFLKDDLPAMFHPTAPSKKLQKYSKKSIMRQRQNAQPG